MKRFFLAVLASHSIAMAKPCTDAASLVAAVTNGAEGARIELAAGTFALREPLVLNPKSEVESMLN